MHKCKIELPNGIYMLDKREFLYCKFQLGSFENKLSPTQILEYIDAMQRLSKGARLPHLIDLRDALGILSLDANRLLAESPELQAIRLAQAFVVNSLSMQLLANFHIQVLKPNCPSKVFTDIEEASEWILKTKEQETIF